MQLGSKKSAALDSAPVCLRVNSNAVYVLTQSNIYQLSLTDLSTTNSVDFMDGITYTSKDKWEIQLGASGKIYLLVAHKKTGVPVDKEWMLVRIYDEDLSLLDSYEHYYFSKYATGISPSSDELYVYVSFMWNAPKKLRVSDWAVVATGNSSDKVSYIPNNLWADADYVYDVFRDYTHAYHTLKKLSAGDLSLVTSSVNTTVNTTKVWAWNGKDYFYICLGVGKPGHTWMFRKSDLAVTFKSWETGAYFGKFKSLVEYEDMNSEGGYIFAVRYDLAELWKIKIEAGQMTSKEDYLAVTGILKPMTVRGREAWVTTSEASYYVRNVIDIFLIPMGSSMAGKLIAAGLL